MRVVFDAIAAALMLATTIIVGAVIWAVFAVLLSGCTPTRYVPAESVRTEYKDNVVEVHTTDSVTDTRFVYIKGDTVIDYRDRVKWRDRYVHDSIYIERHDSVAVPYPVEKPLTRLERAKIGLEFMGYGLVLSVLCVAVVWIVKRFKR